MSSTFEGLVDTCQLRERVSAKYREVALTPKASFHFHTGRELARRLGYDEALLHSFPEISIESFAGVANPFSLIDLTPSLHVVDAGSGSGFDSCVAALQVGPQGQVVGIDMTDEMLEKARSAAAAMQLDNVEFRKGVLEEMPVESGWADVVISNGVFNLCADKVAVLSEVFRILRPGGRLQFADIANGKPLSEGARRNIDLWCA